MKTIKKKFSTIFFCYFILDEPIVKWLIMGGRGNGSVTWINGKSKIWETRDFKNPALLLDRKLFEVWIIILVDIVWSSLAQVLDVLKLAYVFWCYSGFLWNDLLFM